MDWSTGAILYIEFASLNLSGSGFLSALTKNEAGRLSLLKNSGACGRENIYMTIRRENDF
jgi:hypothetical protein